MENNNTSEIIYISSEDDEDVQQNKNNKQDSIIEQLKDNYVHKTEIIENKNERKEAHGQKRKLSEMNNSNDFNYENSVNTCENERSSKICKLEIEEEKKAEGEKKFIKPKLVVKEKKSICSMGQDVFPMFISLCLQKERSDEMKCIVNKLKRRYEQLKPEYAHSEAFCNFLNEKRNEIMNSKNKLYLHISDVMNEMKNSSQGRSTLLLNSRGGSDVKNRTNKVDPTLPSTSYTNDSMSSNETRVSDTDEIDDPDQDIMRRKIRRIVKAMKQCQRQIEKLERSEIDFDDDSNSSYIKEARYKARMVELYNKYCEYTGENADADRQFLRPKHFSPTGIVAVDHAITSFINSKILKKKKAKNKSAFLKALVFPDYHDILQCVKKCNETNNLGLDNRKQQQLAKKAFTEIGEHLQLCRRNDYWDTFSIFLENQEDDPAMKDETLAEQLKRNKLEGEKKLANIFQEYVEKQEEIKDNIVDSKTSSEKEDEDDVSDGHSTDSRENSIETEILENETNLNQDKIDVRVVDTNVIKRCEIVETEHSCTLKDNNNSTKPEKINYSEKVNNCESSRDSKSIIENDAASPVPKTQLSTSFTALLPIMTNNDVPIDEAIEETSIVAIDDASDNIMELKNDLKEEIEENGKEDKPLLRVRSFAKPPTTWEDNQGKMDKRSGNQSKTPIDIVDLTESSSKENLTVFSREKVPIGSNFSNMKGYKIVMVPADNNRENIENTYVSPVTSSDRGKLERGEIPPQQQIRGKPSAKATIIQLVNQRKTQSNQITVSPTIGKDIRPQRPQKTYSAKSLSK